MSGHAALSDRELAARFVAHQDERAFRELAVARAAGHTAGSTREPQEHAER